MDIQLEFYVILLMWLSMLGSNQITGKIIDNLFFQGFIILPGVLAGVVALFVHVFKKKFFISKQEGVWNFLISNFKLEDAFHFLSLIILFFVFYRAMEHIGANGKTAKNESEKLKGNTSQNNQFPIN